MPEAAVTWVRSNCTNPKLVSDIVRTMNVCAAEGVNCWFVIGGDLIRSHVSSLVHCFEGELFVFELSESQAAARDIERRSMRFGRGRKRLTRAESPPDLEISLDRLEVSKPAITQTTPIVGRAHYQVMAKGGGTLCVRLDFEIRKRHQVAWCYPNQPLWGKGMLDISFLPIAPDPRFLTDYKGPLVFFVRLFAMSPGQKPDARRQISNVVATLVDVV